MAEPFLSEKHRVLRRSVRSCCEQELGPIAAQIDREARFPWEVVEKMVPLGYFGIQVPKVLGGGASWPIILSCFRSQRCRAVTRYLDRRLRIGETAS